jgi:hypothetical protein
VVVVLGLVLASELLREDKALVDQGPAGLEHDLRANEKAPTLNLYCRLQNIRLKP